MLLDEFRARMKALDKAILALIRECEKETGVPIVGVETRQTMNGPMFKAKVDL